MTTEHQPDSDSSAKHLLDMIVKGDQEQAAASAKRFSLHREEINDLVDAISDAMNIVSDLHEIDKYSSEQVENCEKAAEKALDVLRPKIRVEQTRISGRVMVAALQGDPHNFDKTLLMTMLEIGGFTALDGGSDMPPQDLVRKVSLLKPDILAVPLVTDVAAKNLAIALTLLNPDETSTRLVAFGRAARNLGQSTVPVEEDSLGALSRIAEVLIAKG